MFPQHKLIVKYSRHFPKHPSIAVGQLKPFLIRRLFYGMQYFHGNCLLMQEIVIQTVIRVQSKMAQKQLLSSLIQSGRKNGSINDFQEAIALGSFPARAELALLCFNHHLPHAECRKAFFLVKEGHCSGCLDCTGMLAHFYATGFKGIVAPCNETAYPLACASADAGSYFGKMALAHFLKGLLRPIDPNEDTFEVLWTDQFIQKYSILSIDVPIEEDHIEDVPADDAPLEDVAADYEDPFEGWTGSDLEDFFGVDRNVLMDYQILRIANLLIEEIEQEDSQRNPNSANIPKV